MSYVSIYAPLPPNSMDNPPNACQAKRNAAIVQEMEQQVAQAAAASAQIATPASFADMGQGVVNDVTRGQNELIAAQSMKSKPVSVGSKQHARHALLNAPTQLPLNVPPEQYSECGIRGIGALLPITIPVPNVASNMPPAAPVDTGLLQTGSTFPGVSRGAYIGPPRKHNKGWFGGMGVVWGDASGSPVQRAQSGIDGKSLLLLALGGLGLYAMTRKGRR